MILIGIHNRGVIIEKTTNTDNKKFVFTILKIIFLTNLPALAIMPVSVKSSIGWIAGSLASAVNFWLMAKNTLDLQQSDSQANVKKISKLFLLRYLFLVVWSIFVLTVVKPELMSFCLGLLAAQISVVLFQAYNLLRNGKLKKYFRGEDE